MPSVAALPIPNSWYAVAFSADLRPGAVVARTLDACCPHLGAHLGIGGRVVEAERAGG
jgi:hypothetical protein